MVDQQSNNAGERHLKKTRRPVLVPVEILEEKNNNVLSEVEKKRAIRELAKVKYDHLNTGSLRFIVFSFNGKEMIYSVSNKFEHCSNLHHEE